MNAFLLSFLCGLVVCSAVPAFAAGPNLCREQEDPLFACRLQNRKFVAVCGQYDPALKQGYRSIVYRFGAPDHLELSLPDDPGQFRSITFTDESTNDQPIEDDQYLRFVHGQFNYVLYTALGKGFAAEGLAVFRDGRLLNKLNCQHSSLELNMAENSLLATGVQPEIDHKTAFSFWSQLLPKNSFVLGKKPTGHPKSRTAQGNLR